jgi:hypothetical protein
VAFPNRVVTGELGFQLGRTIGPMSVLLIVVGAILIVLSIGLAFTIFGVISALLGVVCIGVGAVARSRADLKRKPGK